jgi:hypothetical protein
MDGRDGPLETSAHFPGLSLHRERRAQAICRDDIYEMDRSTAIQCLILLGLSAVNYRVVDPSAPISA